MKKRIGRTFVTVLGVLVLALAACVFAGCNDKTEPKDDPKETAVLTFVEGIDGATNSFTYEAEVGAALGDVFKAVTPKAIDGLEFAGWYTGGAAASDTAKVPSGGLSLEAKYKASYSIDVYTENVHGGGMLKIPSTASGSTARR